MKKSILFSVLVVGATLLQAQSITIHQTCGQNGQVVEVQAVNLGLSVKWANMNVGAESPEDYGNYYAWGETSTKETYEWSTYFDTNEGGDTFIKYNNEGGKTVLDPEDDAAHVNLGGSWRMPTKAECQELLDNCTWTWTKQNGINGYMVTSNRAGYTDKFIFLPAAGQRLDSDLYFVGSGGCYWSSSLREYGPYYAWGLYFSSDGLNLNYRYFGQSVRPVLQASSISSSSSANDTIRIYSNGCDDYQTFIGSHGGQLTMTANSDQWSHFVRWNDGNTDNPRTITTNGNADYTAYFEIYKYSVQVQSNDAARGGGYISKVVKGDTLEYNDSVGSFDAGSEVFLAYQANYGYHFDKWSDGNTSQQRSFILAKDTTFTATFAKNVYTITLKNAEHGSISGGISAEYLDEVTLTANPDYGYHFTQWSDGNKENPRTFQMTQDTTFTAEFAKNTYTITTESSNPKWGTTAGDNSALYLDEVKISATANYGYHFVKWNDNNTSNPRTISVTEDKTYTATFAKNVYTITLKNAEHGSISGGTSAEYLDEVTLTANPDYGYHFTQWSDGNKENPRTFVLTQDTSFTAEFAINNYTIETQSSLPESGIILGEGSYEYLSQQTVTAIPNYGYHFVKWDIDDNTEAISVAQAYAIASALGAGETTTVQYTIVGYVTGKYGTYYNSYYLSDSPNVPGNFIAFKCASSVNIGQYVKVTGYLTNYKGNTPETSSGSAITPNDLSPFANPCSFTLRSNISFVAEFAKNVYTITLNNAEHGSISGDTSAEYLDEVTLTANPDYGYHFTQWSDGNKENPRTFVLTQDTTFNAEFAIDKTGNCGDDNALIWTYDAETKTLTITGNGTLNSNYYFGIEAPTQMQNLVIGNEITSIGDSAFYGMSTINHLIIGGSVATIGNYAFAECRNFDDITCYATIVPIINETTFANVGNKQYIYLFVPAERERAYHRDTYWGEFYIQVQQAEETTVTTNDVTVEPQDNAATVTWPTNDNAASYTIEITKDGVLFCTLTFNANGQLTGIAFAPSREGSHHAPAALMTANGLQFTVTGLNSGTQYGYNLTAKDANDQTVAIYSGIFTTTSEGDAQGLEDVQSDNVQCTKVLINGQIFILRGEKTYTVDGRKVR